MWTARSNFQASRWQTCEPGCDFFCRNQAARLCTNKGLHVANPLQEDATALAAAIVIERKRFFARGRQQRRTKRPRDRKGNTNAHSDSKLRDLLPLVEIRRCTENPHRPVSIDLSSCNCEAPKNQLEGPMLSDIRHS